MCDNVAPFDTSNAYNLYMSSLIAASSPFFYEDTGDLKSNQELTFFVQPKLNETSITRWRGWAIRPEFPNWTIVDPSYWSNLQLAPQVPYRVPPLPDPQAVFRYQPNVDLIAAKSTVVPFGTTLIGKTGAALTVPATAGLRATEQLSNERLLTAMGTTTPGFLKVASTAATRISGQSQPDF